MTTAPSANNRASLLSGLRTGGVRTSSATIPHTAAPGGTFNIPRIVSTSFNNEGQDYLADTSSQNMYGNRTAAVDGPNNRFTLQQQRGMNPNVAPFNPGFTPIAMTQANNAQAQQQALQMQMMQLEIMRMQAVQAQQIQAEMLVQAQRQQQQQQTQNRRTSLNFNPPATAGPLSTGFDIRTATLNAQMRRANQEQQAQLGVASDDHVPMTAALGGKFGSRTTSLNVPMMARFDESGGDATLPPTPSSTTVISGGTSLGNPSSNNTNSVTQSKSDSATSWRRGGKGNSVLANRAVTSPAVKITPPPSERVSPPLPVVNGAAAAAKSRPQPLRFSVVAQQPLPSVTIDTSEANDNDDSSSSSSKSGSSPTTPHSSSSHEMPLSPREEASKKLYEGLGIGRPASAVSNKSTEEVTPPLYTDPNMVYHRLVSQPMRQPRGPPSGADELGPKNFATRIRRKAIGGLGALMGARERRVEVY